MFINDNLSHYKSGPEIIFFQFRKRKQHLQPFICHITEHETENATAINI